MVFETVKLENIADVIDSLHQTPAYSETGFPMIRVTDVKPGLLKFDDALRVDEDVYEKFSKKYKPKAGDIVISRVGSYNGMTSFVNDDTTFCLGQNTAIIHPTNINNKFLYFLFQSSVMKNQISGLSVGSAKKTISLKSIKSLMIPYPSLGEQEKIANLLSSIERKVQVNEVLIKTLEETAFTIFKQWFVDFEFPDVNGLPYKSNGGKFIESELGRIPEEWRVVRGDDIFTSLTGYSYKGKELGPSEDAMVTIKNFHRNGGFKVEGLKEIVISEKVKPHHFVKVGDVIVAHTDLTQNADIIGNPILINSNGGYNKLIMSMDTVKVKSKDGGISNYLIYLILKDNRFKRYALGWTNGTTVLHLSKKAIKNYQFPFPKETLLIELLEKIIKPIFVKCAKLYTQNEVLMKLNDILLPKLMSGELRIPGVEKEVEECLQKSN